MNDNPNKADTSADQQLDTLGLKCPEPVMLIRKTIRSLNIGETLLVSADDPSTSRDVPSFCRFMGHDLLYSQTEQAPFHYLIKKVS